MKRSDLIAENSVIENEIYSESVQLKSAFGTRYTDICLNENDAKRSGVRQGRYTTVFTDSGDVKSCLVKLFSEYMTGGCTLVAGLGNRNICSDSIGVKALRYVPATAHLSEHEDFRSLGMRKVYVIEPGVTGKTGIESVRQIACTAAYIGAECVIVTDSLACSDTERLCSTVQITDTGISPGSGVGNDREAIDRNTVGVPVITAGVPTVIDLESIAEEKTGSRLMVTPRNIDVLTDRLAETIGISISMALNPALSEKELRSLILL